MNFLKKLGQLDIKFNDIEVINNSKIEKIKNQCINWFKSSGEFFIKSNDP